MAQRQLTLSENANEFIQQQLATGKFATADEVVSKTLEEAQAAAANKDLAALIRVGLECAGNEIEFSEESFDQRMDEVRTQFERRRSA